VQVAALDHALQEMRRVVMRPPTSAVPMPLLGRPVDLSKVLACEALAELQKSSAVSITDLAFALHLERSTVSRLMAEAEDEGLIARGSDPEDGRRVTVCLTPLGTQVVTFVQGLRVGYLNHATEVFTGEELTQLASLVGRLAHSMTESFGPWLDEAVRQSTPGAPNA
jgi:DNA-binding MarR family transcriptional regulator